MKHAKRSLLIVLVTLVAMFSLNLVASAYAEIHYVTAEKVRERSTPDISTKKNVVTTHSIGEKVDVRTTKNGWAELDNGNYMSLDFLVSETDPEIYKKLPLYVMADYARERSQPNTDSKIVTTHRLGTTVKVSSLENGWYRLENGNYMRADLLALDCDEAVAHYAATYDDIIVTVIHEQYVRYFQYGAIIAEGEVVTGKNSTPTDIGFFTIQHKQSDFDMNGNSYNHVNHFCSYNGGEGFHDAHWRSTFGLGANYQHNGSHGCTNCPDALSDAIFEHCTKGSTRVLVLP